MRKYGWIVVLGFILQSCYESPIVSNTDLNGIWISERYEKLSNSNTIRIVMVEIKGDRIGIFYNFPNAAFRYSYVEDDDVITITSDAVHPDARFTQFSFSENGGLEFTGPLFGVGQDFQVATMQDLEDYKQQYLLNEYGRWRGRQEDIFFELSRDRPSEYINGRNSFQVTVEAGDGETNYIKSISERGKIEYWEYFVRRNEMIIGFPTGVLIFDRVNEDNIYSFD